MVSSTCPCRHPAQRQPRRVSRRHEQVRSMAATAIGSSRARYHPGSRSSHLISSVPTRHPARGPAAQPHTQVTSRDCPSIPAGPTFVVSSCLIAVGFRGYQFPRTAGHFVFVRPVEFDEQTTSPSRTAQLSGASPVFPIPNPLSGWLLEAVFSVHFQEFQALQALAGSYSPHAVTGTYTLLLSARQRTSRRDPVHPLLPCQTPPSIPPRLHVRPCRLRPKD